MVVELFLTLRDVGVTKMTGFDKIEEAKFFIILPFTTVAWCGKFEIFSLFLTTKYTGFQKHRNDPKAPLAPRLHDGLLIYAEHGKLVWWKTGQVFVPFLGIFDELVKLGFPEHEGLKTLPSQDLILTACRAEHIELFLVKESWLFWSTIEEVFYLHRGVDWDLRTSTFVGANFVHGRFIAAMTVVEERVFWCQLVRRFDFLPTNVDWPAVLWIIVIDTDEIIKDLSLEPSMLFVIPEVQW